MSKQIALLSYNGILYNDENELPTVPFSNIDKSHNVEWRKLGTEHIHCIIPIAYSKPVLKYGWTSGVESILIRRGHD